MTRLELAAMIFTYATLTFAAAAILGPALLR